MTSQRCGGRILAITCLFLVTSAHGQVSSSSSERPAAHREKKRNANKPKVRIEHLDDENGWCIAQSDNFHLQHQDTREFAEAVLRKAEATRATQQEKWFGEIDSKWTPKCSIMLYPSGHAYGTATGAPVHPAGGHTDITGNGGRILSRCVHLHGPGSAILDGVLPHEVTHAILAGRLNRDRVPRWADEGMAILAETQTHVNVHYRHLKRWREEDELFSVREIIQMRDYPRSHALGAFYAQSVALVDFLTHEKDARIFADFVRDGEREGYETSLREHYGWSFAELERRLWQHVLTQEKRENPTENGGGE